jgi:hypothetical protein
MINGLQEKLAKTLNTMKIHKIMVEDSQTIINFIDQQYQKELYFRKIVDLKKVKNGNSKLIVELDKKNLALRK